MTQIMTPSAMTDGQLDKTVDIFRSVLRKHRTELGSDAVQRVLATDEFSNEIVGMLRKRVDAVSDLITRVVKVDRTRTPKAVLDATKRTQYIDSDVVKIMSKGEGEETEVVFFKLGRYVSDADLDKEYELRGLKPADAYSLAAVNEVEPAFADDRPNGTHWKDSKGNWCFAAFRGWRGGRGVLVGRGNDWDAYWWFGGLRK